MNTDCEPHTLQATDSRTAFHPTPIDRKRKYRICSFEWRAECTDFPLVSHLPVRLDDNHQCADILQLSIQFSPVI